jgi:hypothetical protein
MRPGVTHFCLAAATRRNSGRVLSRPTLGIMANTFGIKRKGACGPWSGGWRGCGGPLPWPFEHESHAGVCEPAHWVEKCASQRKSPLYGWYDWRGLYKAATPICQRPRDRFRRIFKVQVFRACGPSGISRAGPAASSTLATGKQGRWPACLDRKSPARGRDFCRFANGARVP